MDEKYLPTIDVIYSKMTHEGINKIIVDVINEPDYIEVIDWFVIEKTDAQGIKRSVKPQDEAYLMNYINKWYRDSLFEYFGSGRLEIELANSGLQVTLLKPLNGEYQTDKQLYYSLDGDAILTNAGTALLGKERSLHITQDKDYLTLAKDLQRLVEWRDAIEFMQDWFGEKAYSLDVEIEWGETIRDPGYYRIGEVNAYDANGHKLPIDMNGKALQDPLLDKKEFDSLSSEDIDGLIEDWFYEAKYDLAIDRYEHRYHKATFLKDAPPKSELINNLIDSIDVNWIHDKD